jgi:hypothetical protein
MNAATEELKHLRRHYGDLLLTLLTALLVLMMFVFAPLQAAGYFLFQAFAIAGLLAIIGGAIIISSNTTALILMSIALVANVSMYFWRLYQPWPYDLYLLSAAWLVIALTVGSVVAGAVFRRGRITYHRIIGAILLYLMIALAFTCLFAFIGLAIPGAFTGVSFEGEPTLVNSLFFLSFGALTSSGFADIIPNHPLARSLCNLESVIGQLFMATLLARLVTLELRGHRND